MTKAVQTHQEAIRSIARLHRILEKAIELQFHQVGTAAAQEARRHLVEPALVVLRLGPRRRPASPCCAAKAPKCRPRCSTPSCCASATAPARWPTRPVGGPAVREADRISFTVIPAKAGIHLSACAAADQWVPAFAGTTYMGIVDF